jgi:hypothetical protein
MACWQRGYDGYTSLVGGEREFVMVGVIGKKELVSQAVVIVREFGLRLYLECVMRTLRGERFTFLEVVMAHGWTQRST